MGKVPYFKERVLSVARGSSFSVLFNRMNVEKKRAAGQKNGVVGRGGQREKSGEAC